MARRFIGSSPAKKFSVPVQINGSRISFHNAQRNVMTKQSSLKELNPDLPTNTPPAPVEYIQYNDQQNQTNFATTKGFNTSSEADEDQQRRANFKSIGWDHSPRKDASRVSMFGSNYRQALQGSS